MCFWRPGRTSERIQIPKRVWLGLCLLLAADTAPGYGLGISAPTREATAGFDRYVSGVETRLKGQHESVSSPASSNVADGFLSGMKTGDGGALIHELRVERLTPRNGPELPGALLHHWRGTAFAPGATVEEFERLMKDLPDYPKVFAPQVVAGSVISRQNVDHLRGHLRMRQHHGLTVILDSTYQVDYVRPNAGHGYHSAVSTELHEVEDAGSPHERVLPTDEGHGYLWRQNTYWSYEQADGGLYLQVESISLTRSIPVGLAWAVGPFVESIPRESLEFTLRCVLNALRK